MKFRTTWLVLALWAAVAVVSAAQGDSARTLLEGARKMEVVDGDLNGAIKRYQTIVDQYSKTDRASAATALVRMAECYQKLGDAESRTIYERVLREFADQAESVARARARLAALQSVAPSQPTQAARLVWSGQDAFGSVRGSISPDGRYLPFLDLATGGLGIRDLRENTNRVVTQGSGSMFYAVFSPDGRQVAYAWSTQTGKDIRGDLRVIPSTAGEASQSRIVYRNEEMISIRPFGWTPDGKRVLVLGSLKGGTNQIAMVSVLDGSIRVIKSVPWSYTTMSLSPDGRFIAHDAPTGNNTGPSEIYVLAADGSRETLVVPGPAGNSSPLWSPDGSRVLFLSDRTGNNSLWSMRIADGKPEGPAELLKADIGRVRLQGITRSGTLHYLVSGVSRTNIYVAELDAALKATRAPAAVTDRFINSNSAPTWSPDGRQLAYLSSRGRSAAGVGSATLVIRTIATGEERDLPLPKEVQTGNLVPAPRWFPDGRSVLVLGLLSRGGGLFYRVDMANGKAEILREAKGVSGNGGLGANAISPDGRTVFYIASVSEPYAGVTDLRRFEIDSQRETVLKTGTFNSLALSPDGTQIVLRSYDGTPGGCHLEVMPVGGGETRRVVRTGDCNPNRLTWAPHDDLLFVRGGNGTPNVLWRVPAAGGEPEPIGISMSGQLMFPHVRPDGRQITFGVFETGASEVWALEHFLAAQTANRQTAKR